MSRRASFLAKAKREKPPTRSVRFSDELVFQDNVKENDIPALLNMLRRNSLQMDINTINTAGLSALHQAVLDDNLAAVKLLLNHKANVNLLDEDTWTPLHAACANGFHNIARLLLQNGADPHITNEDGERPIDLVDPTDFETISVVLQHMQAAKENDKNDDDNDNDDDDDDDENGYQDESNEVPAPVTEDSNAEDDRCNSVSTGNARPKREGKIERLSSKYLDSDDDNLEYVSEDDDDEVVFRRQHDDREHGKQSGSSDHESVGSDHCAARGSHRYSIERDKLSDSYVSNASGEEGGDFGDRRSPCGSVERDTRSPSCHSDDDRRFYGLVRTRSDPGYVRGRITSRESGDRTTDMDDSEAFRSDDSRWDQSPDSARIDNLYDPTISRGSSQIDVNSSHKYPSNPESAKYDTDSDYGQLGPTDWGSDTNNGKYYHRSDASDGYIESC